MEVVYVYQKKRRQFGRQPLLQDKPSELTTDITPDAQMLNNYQVKNPSHHSVQTSPEQSEHDVNTESFVVCNRGILHKEGGWPKDVDSTDVEHTLRFRKKIEKDEEYIKTMKGLSESMEHYIKQNNAIDIYEEYFPTQSEDSIVASPSAKTLNVFRDPNDVKRSVSYLSWYPDHGHKVAVAYSILQFQQMPSNMSYDSYIWDVENPKAPDQKLIPSSPLVSLKYNPKDPHILIGGTYNGLVSYWDTRKGPYPVETSTIEKSHRDPVFGLTWASSKTGSEFFSTSTDGQVLWWDIRKLSEPTDTMVMDPERNGNYAGGTVVDFESTMPTKFMVGSENGSAFLCNKKAKTAAERITHVYPGHHGPVYALQRNPFFNKNFLTVGDWSAKIWVEDIRSPIMSTKYRSAYLTDGCWSPTRPAVFFTSKMDGSVDVWDFVFKQNDPTLSLQISDVPLQCVKVQDRGQHLLVGDRNGTTTLVELSDNLVKMQHNEKAVFSQMLEREGKREKTLEGYAREKRLKAQQKAPPPPKGIEEAAQAALQSAEEDFFRIIKEDDKKAKK